MRGRKVVLVFVAVVFGRRARSVRVGAVRSPNSGVRLLLDPDRTGVADVDREETIGFEVGVTGVAGRDENESPKERRSLP